MLLRSYADFIVATMVILFMQVVPILVNSKCCLTSIDQVTSVYLVVQCLFRLSGGCEHVMQNSHLVSTPMHLVYIPDPYLRPLLFHYWLSDSWATGHDTMSLQISTLSWEQLWEAQSQYKAVVAVSVQQLRPRSSMLSAVEKLKYLLLARWSELHWIEFRNIY